MVDCKKMETILVANHLVNKYGLDTLETGGLIAWAMELYEKGIIDDNDTAGLKLEWGDSEVLFKLITLLPIEKPSEIYWLMALK